MAVAVARAGRRQRRPPSTRVTLLVGVPVAVGAGCWAYTRDFRAGWLESWPPPRRVGVAAPWDPVVDCLPLLLTVLGALVLAAGLWGWRHPDARPTWLVRSWWRRYSRYQWRWRKAMRLGGFTARMDDRVLVPRIVRVRCNAFVDRVLVKSLPMHEPDDYVKWAVSFAQTFGALRCTVVDDTTKGGRFWLEFLRKDPLMVEVPALPIPAVEKVDLMAVPIGRYEDGSPWTIPVLGAHHLFVGMMGSGKSAGLWSLLRGLAPAIKAGSVQVWGCDGKGGIELGMGRDLFHKLIINDPDQLEAMLEEAVMEHYKRSAGADGELRKVEPSVSEPMIILVLDEFAGMTALLQDRQQAGRIMRWLGILLTQARATGICVMGCVQTPLKAVVDTRDYFSHRIVLRVREATHVDAGLGAGARARGAVCDGPLCALPGTGFMQVESEVNPRRGRLAHVLDGDIRAMAREYAAPGRLRAVASDPQAAATPAQPKGAKRRKLGAAKTLMTGPVPRTPEQVAVHEDILKRWASEGFDTDRVRTAEFTIMETPLSDNDHKSRNKWDIDRQKKHLQRLFVAELERLGLDTPIRKDGQLVAQFTFRFATRHAREVDNFEARARKAFWDAARRSDDPKAPRWIVDDTDDQKRTLEPAISGGRGEPATTVRLTWRESS